MKKKRGGGGGGGGGKGASAGGLGYYPFPPYVSHDIVDCIMTQRAHGLAKGCVTIQ